MDAAVRPTDMFAIFERFDPRLEEAAGDLGASPGQACGTWCCRPSVVGIAELDLR